jgi:dTDP-4-amino-4,6-dideoxygalactose transaminase
MSIGKEELEAVQRVMQRGILSGYKGNWSGEFYGGFEISELENEWKKHFKVDNAVACNSATSGLWMALNAIGLGTDDEVIVTPYSMTCSASIPLLFGAKPVFADIEPDYFCIDPNDVVKKITDKTRAIIAVDLFGQSCDYDRLQEISRTYGLKLIVDAAQAPATRYYGNYTTTLGDISVYSLNYHKHVHCGEGGMVVTNDSELDLNLRLSMNHAEAAINDMNRKDITVSKLANIIGMVGMNLRMTELSAAIAREQLKKLDGIMKGYRRDAECFNVKVRPNTEHSFYRYAWRGDIPEWTTGIHDRCEFGVKRGYVKPIFQMPLFRSLGYDQNQCPVVQQVEKEICQAWRKEPY